MRKIYVAILLMVGFNSYSQNNAYEKAWKALNENNRTEAAKLFSEAQGDASTFQDAYISNIYLASYNGKEKLVTDFTKSFYEKVANPYPYVFAMWFNQAVLGETGKKYYPHQLKLIDELMADDKAPGTLVASANYQKGMHNLFSNDFDKTQKYYDAVGSIRNWQYTGPFENLSESGFYKNYGPLDHPEPTAVFKSLTNADVKWITPAAEITDGWTPVCYQFNKQTAVVYAQNFVSSPADQEVYCNFGVSGSMKVWINDELVISESKERVTDMDTYTVKYNLKKGVNRVLVQIGFTSSNYPNFNLRFTDEKYKQIPGITGSSTYAVYPKATANKTYTLIPHFAESYFSSRISKDPDNLLNYLLLTDVYLRSKKIIEARNLISDAILKAPNNCLLKMKLIEVLIKENNRTLLLEEIEKIKQLDPESLVVLDLNIKEFFDNQKYEDGAVELEKRIRLHGEDESTGAYKILLLVHENKYEELVKEAEKMYAKYPNNSKMVQLMYTIKKDVYKDKRGAMKVYETFMKDNYDYDIYSTYASLLTEQGNNGKALDIKKDLAERFPYSSAGFYGLSQYYYTAKQYDKAEENINKALAISPYNENYWEQLGDIKNEQKLTNLAMDAYNRSLLYDPNQYSIINKIRKLYGKPEANKLFPETDINKTIKEDKLADAKNTDYGYYIILDEKNVIIYPGGANEEYCTLILRMTNEKGVDEYKESSIGYGSSQNLLIEKAEIIKKNQSKIEGERNGNQVVFTNLEVGDVIVFKYRMQSFVYGRFAKEYWDKYFFNGQIYTATTNYNMLVPASQKINYVNSNMTLQPMIKDVEDFKMYSWTMTKPEPLKDEPLMPVMADVAAVLHISTVPAWKEIADWYTDICNNKAEEDFEIIALYKKLFPEGQKSMTQFQKAKIIYDYIEANIRYSSVSFRQSAFVPQRPSSTLTTRLGDCKDLSSLFITLAHMAGINAQMVLVDTRDNGEKQILLPSVEFNHCIAKAILDNKSYYVELTDNYLPFTSLPNNLNGAVILEIPSKSMNENTGLQLLKAPNRTRDIIKRVMDIKPNESDLNITMKTVLYGNSSSTVRGNYVNLDKEKQVQEMEKTVAGRYKNIVKLDKVSFTELDKLNDSIMYTYNFKVKNEVSEIGSMQTFRIVYPDVVASLDKFSSDERRYPVEYWSYEDVDTYETVVNITAPAGKKFLEVPVSETLSYKGIKFTMQYTLKAPDKLVVTRKFTNDRKNIPAEDYAGFKSFFEKVVKAEQKFIAYK